MQTKKSFRIIYWGIILFLALALSNCNDAPTQVAMHFLSDTVSIEIIAGEENSVIVDAYSYTIKNPVERNSGTILVGIHNDLKAGALMRFDIFSVPASIREVISERIVSCELHIFPRQYAIGDTAGSNQLNFEIKEVTGSWTYETTTSDDVFNSDNLFVNSRLIADWSGKIERKDSMDAMIFDFPTDLCVEWLETVGDIINITDTVWGIAILPKPGSTIINSFKSLNNFSIGSDGAAAPGAVLKVTYYKDEEKTELDSFEMRTVSDVSFVESKEANPTDDLILQGGVRIHSKIDFDVSQIPEFACIHYAEITLTLDIARSYSGNINPTDAISLIKFSSDNDERFAASKSNIIVGEYDSVAHTVTFRGSFGSMPFCPLSFPFNIFLRNNDGKGTLVLTFQDINQSANYLNKFVFYGANAADISKRPKIKLVYSKLY